MEQRIQVPQSEFNLITKFWPLVITILGMAVTWGIVTQKISTLRDDLNIARTQQTALATEVTGINKSLSRIEAQLEILLKYSDDK